MNAIPFDRKNRARLALAAAILAAALFCAPWFHHHEDGESHEDCPLCLALHQAQAGSIRVREAVQAAPAVLPERVRPPGIGHFASEFADVPVIRPPPVL